MISVATTKRFERAGKRTVIRKMTEEKFHPGIERLYSEDRFEGLGSGPVLTQIDGLGAVKNFVRASHRIILYFAWTRGKRQSVRPGLDSLKTVEIVGILKAGILRPGVQASFVSWLSTKTVYKNTTI